MLIPSFDPLHCSIWRTSIRLPLTVWCAVEATMLYLHWRITTEGRLHIPIVYVVAGDSRTRRLVKMYYLFPVSEGHLNNLLQHQNTEHAEPFASVSNWKRVLFYQLISSTTLPCTSTPQIQQSHRSPATSLPRTKHPSPIPLNLIRNQKTYRRPRIQMRT